MKYQHIPLQVSLVLRYLHQEKGETLQRLVELYPKFKRTTIYRHMKKQINDTTASAQGKSMGKRGRSRTYTERDKRHIVSALKRLYETHGNFSDTDIPVSITYQKEQFVDYLTKRDTASNSAEKSHPCKERFKETS